MQFGQGQATPFRPDALPSRRRTPQLVANHLAGSCDLYENGTLVHTFGYDPRLTGVVGIGQWFDASAAANHVDLFTGTILGAAAYDGELPAVEIQIHASEFFSALGIGAPFCSPGVANSSGQAAVMGAFGSANIADNNLLLRASGLPSNSFAMFLVSSSTGNLPNLGGGQGILCLSTPLLALQSRVRFSGAAGIIEAPIDFPTSSLPTTGAAIPGSIWYFQAWYRDQNPGYTTNLTDGFFVHLH